MNIFTPYVQGLKLKPMEQKETNVVNNDFQNLCQSITKTRIESIIKSLIDTSEDDAEISNVSQHVKQDMAEPLY